MRRSGPLAVSRACEVVRQAALGFQHAHEKGVCHGALTPGCLRVGRSAVKVADFGLGRAGGADYLAPELFDPAAVPTPRSDLYALGGVLYHLLTGRTPFPAVAARGQAPPPPRVRPGAGRGAAAGGAAGSRRAGAGTLGEGPGGPARVGRRRGRSARPVRGVHGGGVLGRVLPAGRLGRAGADAAAVRHDGRLDGGFSLASAFDSAGEPWSSLTLDAVGPTVVSVPARPAAAPGAGWHWPWRCWCRSILAAALAVIVAAR